MYRVILTRSFQQQLQSLYSSHPQEDELVKAIEWAVRRAPRSLSFAIAHDLFLWITDLLPIKTIAKVKIVYHVNDEKKIVKLISIAEHIDQP